MERRHWILAGCGLALMLSITGCKGLSQDATARRTIRPETSSAPLLEPASSPPSGMGQPTAPTGPS